MNGSNHCLQLVSNKQLEWNHDILWKSETDNKVTRGCTRTWRKGTFCVSPAPSHSQCTCVLLGTLLNWMLILVDVCVCPCVSLCVVCVAEYLGFWLYGIFFFGNRFLWNPQGQRQFSTHLVAGDDLELLVYLPHFPSAEIPALDLVHPLTFSPGFRRDNKTIEMKSVLQAQKDCLSDVDFIRVVLLESFPVIKTCGGRNSGTLVKNPGWLSLHTVHDRTSQSYN